MLYKIKAHKDKIYSRLGVLYFLITLSFEGVVPTRVCGFPDLNDYSSKGYRDPPVADSPASSTNKNKDLRQM
jgi:hypothetical protein